MKSLSHILLVALLLIGWGIMDAQQGRANGQRNQASTDTETRFNGKGLSQNQRTRRSSVNDRFSKENRSFRGQNKAQQRANRNNQGAFRHARRDRMHANMNKPAGANYQPRQNGMRKKGSQGQGLKNGNGQGFQRGKESI